jgi:hypothetical protein
MATLCKTYPTEIVARKAAQALRAAGVPGRDICLLAGCRMRDVREEPVGTFAGTIGPDAPVGTFANRARLRSQGAGTFAGDSDCQREGSFADAEHAIVVSYENGAAHPHLVGDHTIRRLLRALAAADPDGRVVDELHLGHAVVIAQVAEIAPGDAEARLDEFARAA